MQCRACGGTSPPEATFCAHCGGQVDAGPVSVEAATAAPLQPATQGMRLVNLIIDGVLISFVQTPAAFVVGFTVALLLAVAGANVERLANSPLWELLGFVVGLAVYFVYYSVFEALLGKTPGKFITRTRVLNLDGSKPGLGAALLRSLCRLIPFEPFSFFGSKRPSGWHDSLAKTIVVED